FVKLQCLRLLVGAKLSPAKAHLVFGFVDMSLNLSEQEEKIFQKEFAKIEPRRRKKTMEIITSYERRGIEKGIKIGKQEGIKLGKREGLKEGVLMLVSRLLKRQIGSLPVDVRKRLESLSVKQLEKLSDALFQFSDKDDLLSWLDKHSTTNS